MQSPSELLLTIAELNRERQYFRIISLLEERENDYALCLELVRAYINAANQTSDPLSLLDKAQLVLSQFALSGKDDPTYLFYEGYILYKKGLGQDDVIRLDDNDKEIEDFKECYALSCYFNKKNDGVIEFSHNYIRDFFICEYITCSSPAKSYFHIFSIIYSLENTLLGFSINNFKI